MRPIRKVTDNEKKLSWSWSDLVDIVDNKPCWKEPSESASSEQQHNLELAQAKLLDNIRLELTGRVFGKTYFALEESGQAYVTVQTKGGKDFEIFGGTGSGTCRLDARFE